MTEAVTTPNHHAFAFFERRHHQKLGGVAGLVLFFVRHDGQVFEFDFVFAGQFAAGFPEGVLGLVQPVFVVSHERLDAVRAAFVGVEGELGRGLGRGHFLQLDLGLFFVIALGSGVFVLHQQELYVGVDAGQYVTVDIGHDEFEIERRVLIHERLFGFHAHVAFAGVNQQRRGGGLLLAVHVGHARGDRNGGGLGRRHLHEVHAQ